MKNILLVFTLLVLFVNLLSCTKKSVTTITKTDTVVVNARFPSKTQLLTAHTWEVEESFEDILGAYYHYKRGGDNNMPLGENPAAIRWVYRANGTGLYTDPDSSISNITWAFSPADSTIINEIITYYSTQSFATFNLVEITDSTLSFTYIAGTSDDGEFSSFRFIPAP